MHLKKFTAQTPANRNALTLELGEVEMPATEMLTVELPATDIQIIESATIEMLMIELCSSTNAY